MDRLQKRKMDKLTQKIEEEKRKGNFLQALQLHQELDALLRTEKTEIRMTLKDAMKDYSAEDRREMTTQVIIAIAIADMLNSATMDVESKFRKFGISGVPMMEELREVSKRLAKAVATIDSIGNELFSENYMDIVDSAETKVMSTLKNYINNELHKLLKRDNGGISK